jgi:hypothetical protein
MEITVTRSGGIAGVNEQLGPVNTTRLEPERAAEVEHLLEQSKFFDLPEHLPTGRGFDLFYYRMTVRSDGRDHSVSFDDSTPDEDRSGINTIMAWLRDNGFEFEQQEVATDGMS